MKTKKQERFLKKFNMKKIIDKPKEERRYSIPVYIQRGIL